MDKYKLETSIQLPFFKLNELVSYTEVKKPSGIAFMILVLLSESKDRLSKISSVLVSFGVPENLHYLFANTIDELIRQGFLEMKGGADFNPSSFASYSLNDILFTGKGKKIFAEKAIPTGTTKEAKIPVFYNIALNKLAIAIDASLEPRPLMDSPITDGFMSRFACAKDVEQFLNQNKGVRISIYENGKVARTELIKQEEVITEVVNQSTENWVGKYDCEILLDGDACSFSFEDKTIQKFFESNYTGAMINDFITRKSKFHFSGAFESGLKLSSYCGRDVVGILVPKDMDAALKQKGRLFLTKGNYSSSSYQTSISSKECFAKYDDTCEFITVDLTDNKIAYVPGGFSFDSSLFGTITLPLVLKIRLSQSDLKEALTPYVDSLSTYSEDNFRSLVRISAISKDYDKAYVKMERYLNEGPEKNIVRLNEMKPTAIQDANILSKYKQLLRDNYGACLESIEESGLETFLKITAQIPKFLNIPAKEVIERIAARISPVKDSVGVYEAFADAGFDKNVIAVYFNPVDGALKSKLVKDKTLVDLVNFDENLSLMKSLSKIGDYRSYSYDEESINKTDFKKAFTTAKPLFGAISFFRISSDALFRDYDGFLRVFGAINDDFNMMDAALSNPKSIKPELITKKIDSGEYQFALVNLSAKLELTLKDKYKLSGKLSEMLSEARRSGAIERAIATDLHDFREVRNSYTHGDGKQKDFTPDDLRRWAKEIFELEETKDEPSSNG